MIFFRSLMILFGFWLFGFACFLIQIETSEKPLQTKADAIIVFTGAKGRIDAGLNLLASGQAKYLFVSGVGQNAVLDDLSRHLSSFELEQLESLRPYISLGHEASSTEENAEETMQWVRANKFTRIILVTSNYHMQRSLCTLCNALPEVEVIPYHVVKNEQFWRSQAALKLIFLEYNKWILSYLKGMIAR